MTAQMVETPAAGSPETGWAQSRRQGKQGVRTCLPALEEQRGGPRRDRTGPEWNIVRGED
ncbi:hypothetical protein [Streptomyces sp. SID10815]|uniref:Uncharacterized protein n=1 Tax=Streptomyces similanensis TaxID=1274988 RepID=A0ABP9L7A6_9ACTN|nr:hypothetical protein [Streptomyces sp. SID10815]NEA44790.1 hypothetical protein [Streptomyces sp. SID10815]